MGSYVLTGGPGVGKTTLLNLLKESGFETVPEAASIIIEESLESGSDCLPWKNNPEFQNRVFELQLELEQENREKNLVFFDRGVLDGYAFVKFYGEIPSRIYNEIGPGRYEGVFLLEPVPNYCNDHRRRESELDAKYIHNEIRSAYEKFGYKPIEIPASTPVERMEFVISHVYNNEKQSKKYKTKEAKIAND